MTKTAPAKPLYKRRWFIAVATVAIIASVIVIVVPLAILLPRRGKHNATVLLPLYIYPNSTTTWDPLYSVVTAHPDLKFIVVVNPSSGPGSSEYPDDHYAASLSKLSAYSNVETVGYVRTGYASRNLSDVLSEVSTYAGWALKNSSYAMHGIFFDESPYQFTDSAVAFMRSATQGVKQAKGLQGAKTVIRNPGVIPDARFNDSNTDISVVFEQSYAQYQLLQGDLAALTEGRSHYAYLLHSVPAMAQDKLQELVGDLNKHAEFLFVTTNSDNYYESFGSDWADFADVVRI